MAWNRGSQLRSTHNFCERGLFDYLKASAWEASNLPHIWVFTDILSRDRGQWAPFWPFPYASCLVTRISQKRVYTSSSSLIFAAAPGDIFKLPGSGGQSGLYLKVPQTVTNEEKFINQLPSQGHKILFVAVTQGHPLIIRLLWPVGIMLVWVWFPFSLNIGTDWDPPFWDTEKSWYILNY